MDFLFTELTISILIISLMSIGWSLLFQEDNIFYPIAKKLDSYYRNNMKVYEVLEYIKKPFYGCSLCVSGQIALWYCVVGNKNIIELNALFSDNVNGYFVYSCVYILAVIGLTKILND